MYENLSAINLLSERFSRVTYHSANRHDYLTPINEMDDKRIQALKQKIADLKARWPAHSVPPALMRQLDDLEEELAEALAQQSEQEVDHG